MEAGYQSDFNLEQIQPKGNLPAVNNLGGFGITEGQTDNVYTLTVTPKLTKPYPIGLSLQVQFHKENTSGVTLEVDDKGAVPIKRFNGTDLIALEQGALNPKRIYHLIFGGDHFQLLNSQESNTTIVNFVTNHVLIVDRISNQIAPVVNNENYTTINYNLVVATDLKIRRKDGIGALDNAFIKLPKPATIRSKLDGILWTNKGRLIEYEIDEKGIMELRGEISEPDELIIVNFRPYIAVVPLEYDDTVSF